MRFEDLIAEKSDALTGSDRKLVNVLLVDPTVGSFMPAHKIAERAGVHPSTAGRLARKLGFDSYRAMREAMVFELDASARVRNRLDSATGQTLLESVIAGEIATLSRVTEQVGQEEIAAATEYLRRARRIIVVGESHAGSLAELFARRLKRSGYLAMGMSHADWETADELISLTDQDMIFGMTFRHDSPGVMRALKLARETGAGSVLLTDLIGPQVADVTITARRGEPGQFQSLTVPMAICNTLILELSQIDEGRSLEGLAKLENLRIGFLNAAATSRRA